MGYVRIGTCSWTEPTMLKRWYPPGVNSAEARLRYYADRFDTVEVDSTFYALPDPDRAQAWAERTPEWFVFHVKAFGLMTRHSVSPKALESPLDEYEHALTRYGRVKDPSPELLDAVFARFEDGVAPLRAAGKLGGVLLQFPKWFSADTEQARRRNLDYLDYAADRLAGLRVLVEFRDPSWLAERIRTDTMGFLIDRGMTYVSVDAPRLADGSSMPPVAQATSDWAYVRLHGRNAETWASRTASAADRFDYLYGEDELREWEEPVRRLARETETTFVLFNNNKYDYAQRNARQMNEILEDLLMPVEHAPHDGSFEQESLF
jgi:uncharacterized protein YecE (DUF72 family)